MELSTHYSASRKLMVHVCNEYSIMSEYLANMFVDLVLKLLILNTAHTFPAHQQQEELPPNEWGPPSEREEYERAMYQIRRRNDVSAG